MISKVINKREKRKQKKQKTTKANNKVEKRI